MQSWMQNHHTEVYLTQNEGKSVLFETFIQTLNIKSAMTMIWLQYQKMCLLVN